MKTKADLNDIALAEADIINLKKKVEDLECSLINSLRKNLLPWMIHAVNVNQIIMQKSKLSVGSITMSYFLGYM